MKLSNRHKRESHFFDEEYSNRFSELSIDNLESLLKIEVQQVLDEYPDHYRYAYKLLGDISGSKVLDLGCGDGKSSVILAKKGAHVNACDISKKAIEYTKIRARLNSVQNKVTCEVSAVENMSFSTNNFDYIFGVAILHHINIENSLPEINRVLKPGGKAIFVEPISFSFILDKIRHLRIVTSFIPDSGQDVLITDDEKQISIDEFYSMKNVFKSADYKAFRLLSRLDRIICGYPVNEQNSAVRLLNKIDRILLSKFRFLSKYGGLAVIC